MTARRVVLTGAVALLAGVGAMSPTVASPDPQVVTGEPRAAAWLLDVSAVSDEVARIQVAHARAEGGATPHAWGAPLTVNGTSPQSAGATAAQPEAGTSAVDVPDETGSMTMTGGYARAAVSGGGATAGTGLAAGSGSGFAMASRLFTWEQQEQLTGQLAALNDAVFDPLNARLQALAPVFAAAGLTVPTLSKMSAVAVINVASGDLAAASVGAASAAGLATAKAAVTLSSVQLLDRFVELHDVTAEADSQSVDGAQTRSARVRIGTIRVAGVDVTLDESGLRAAGSTVLARTTVQPALDLLTGALLEHGVTLRAGRTAASGDLRQATAFQLAVAGPQGGLDISIGHVEASAATVASGGTPGAEGPAPAPAASSPPEPPVVGAGPGVDADPPPATTPVSPGGAPVVAAPPGPISLPGTAPAASAGVPRWLGATLPVEAARALGTVFVLLLLAGLGTALIPVLLMRPRPSPQRRPLLDPEVLP